MRALRILILLVFIVTGVLFGVNEYRYLSDIDDEPPVITSNSEEIALSVESGEEDYLQGVIAIDETDGTVTDSLVFAGRSNFIEEGLVRADYAAFDSHNNVGTYSRNVRFYDYRSPQFSSLKPLMFKKSSSYDFDFIQASDVLDGDISNKVKILYSNLYSATEDAPILLEVTNSVGDIEKLEINVRIVTPQEYNHLYPALWGYITYAKVGEPIDPWGMVAGTWQNGEYYGFEETEYDYENVTVDANAVDYDTPGVYEIIYHLNPVADERTPTGDTILYVVVRDE